MKEMIVPRTYKVMLFKIPNCFPGQELLYFLIKNGMSSMDAELACAQLLETHVITRVGPAALAAFDKLNGPFPKSSFYRWAEAPAAAEGIIFLIFN